MRDLQLVGLGFERAEAPPDLGDAFLGQDFEVAELVGEVVVPLGQLGELFLFDGGLGHVAARFPGDR